MFILCPLSTPSSSSPKALSIRAAPCYGHVCLNQHSVWNHASCLSVCCFSLDLPVATPHPDHHEVHTDGWCSSDTHSQWKKKKRKMLRRLAWRNRFLLASGLFPHLPQVFWMKLLPSRKWKAITQYQNLDLDLNFLEGAYISTPG